MDDQIPRPEVDRILVAQLTGEARHHAKWRPLTGEEEAAALAELRALADGRGDLLAEVAGIFEGTSEGESGFSVTLAPPVPGHTAWMWHPCRTSDMNAASTSYPPGPAWLRDCIIQRFRASYNYP